MASPFEVTKDGYEIQWQTNFLAHHALTLCLLPIFRQTAQLNPGHRASVRIVNVVSDLAFSMGPKNIDYRDPNLTDLTGRLAPW
jgi:NAD(P)-dependent dehydrogenase (short-subunit alcohol dehydrogenase family)